MQGAGAVYPNKVDTIILASRIRLMSVTAKLTQVAELLDLLKKDLREKNLTTARKSETTLLQSRPCS